MKLSVIVICWNDLEVLRDCLASLHATTRQTPFELIVTDNGSTDGSIAFVREHYPHATVIENGHNLGFARANNVAVARSNADYQLILNPDTILHDGAIDRWVAFADRHPDAGAFACRVLNRDGTLQKSARPFPTIARYWRTALGLRSLGRFSERLLADEYAGWDGTTERPVDWQYGCAVLIRGPLMHELGGFDERFFFNFEEVDLCKRVWDAGHQIVYCPEAVITHLGGQSTGRFPLVFAVEKYRNRYRYFFKHHGAAGARRCRSVSLASLRLRRAYYGIANALRRERPHQDRLEQLRVLVAWNQALDPVRFARDGVEPTAGDTPLTPSQTAGQALGA